MITGEVPEGQSAYRLVQSLSVDKQHDWDLRPWSLSPELLLSHDTTLSLQPQP